VQGEKYYILIEARWKRRNTNNGS